MRPMFSLPRRSWSFLWRWAPPLVWTVVVSAFSTDAFSAEHTGDFLIPLLRWLLPGASPATLELLHAAIRKGMHAFEFGILALLWYRALSWDGSGWQTRAALAAFLLAAGFATLDEIHQIFVEQGQAHLHPEGGELLLQVAGQLGCVHLRGGGLRIDES